ncbi:MAG: TIGR03790 family protein [Thermodesulfobacteriota bacterium]
MRRRPAAMAARPAGLAAGLLVLLAVPLSALALSAADLAVVYNRRHPASEGLARYYAEKREVPLANLCPVEVSPEEEISRQDYEDALVPPVRAAVAALRAAGRRPAVLLVHGVPLRIRDQTAADTSRSLLAEQRRQVAGLFAGLGSRLSVLLAASGHGSPPWQPEPEAAAPVQAERLRPLLVEAGRLLASPAASPAAADQAREAASLALRLTGLTPAAAGILQQAPEPGPAGRSPQELVRLVAILRADWQRQSFLGTLPSEALARASLVRLTDGLLGELSFWEGLAGVYAEPRPGAAVDSELVLVAVEAYQTAQWLPNPFHDAYRELPVVAGLLEQAVMVGRLDGPSPTLVRRLVDDALAVEAQGLAGTFCIDARDLTGEPAAGSYPWYDAHLRRLAEVVQDKGAMPVRLDSRPELFGPGDCPDAALYVGWYSRAQYVDAFTWQRGAVAFHVASSEARTLRQAGSQVWAKRLLEEGVAATIGPVAEPYLESFPLPDHFFPLLMTGRLPLLEVYFRSLPHVSWRQILVGDPLYTPFQAKPALAEPLPRPEPPGTGAQRRREP